MCDVDTPKMPETPAPVKQTSSDVAKARDAARSEAIRRYGVSSTDKTRGNAGQDKLGV